ncbi:MAG: hypothetical protein H6715_05605 [Myxococcales bacterium]|nr:hypothetical protein [Myxococcales bacterium]
MSARRAQEVATIGCISRPLLIAVLDKGLGHFLRGVRTEPEMTQGRFRGFRIVELYPRDPMFQHKSPRAGDIVTTVNGQPIARPEQAVKVWESLRVASELRIAFVRDGNEDEARYRIVD